MIKSCHLWSVELALAPSLTDVNLEIKGQDFLFQNPSVPQFIPFNVVTLEHAKHIRHLQFLYLATAFSGKAKYSVSPVSMTICFGSSNVSSSFHE